MDTPIIKWQFFIITNKYETHHVHHSYPDLPENWTADDIIGRIKSMWHDYQYLYKHKPAGISRDFVPPIAIIAIKKDTWDDSCWTESERVHSEGLNDFTHTIVTQKYLPFPVIWDTIPAFRKRTQRRAG